MRPFKLQALQITTAKSLGFAQTRAAHKSFSHEKKKKTMHTLETLPKLFSLFCICRPAPARENTTVRPEGFPSP